MNILSRYILKQHAVPFVFALSAVTSILLLNQVAKRFGDLVGKGLPWGVILEVFALSVPFLVAMTLPMAVLVAVLYAFSHLAADNEITAVRAGGISLWRLVRPVLLAAAITSVLAFLFSDHVLPASNHRLRTLLMDIGRKKPTFSLKEQVINEVQPNRFFLRAGRIDQSIFRLRDVTIYDLADPQRNRIVYADSGYMAFSTNQQDLHLTLYDGSIHEFDRYNPKMFQYIGFRKDVIRVEGVGNELSRTISDTYRGDREMGVCEMEAVIRDAHRERRLSAERARTVWANDIRPIVGLAPVPLDTTTRTERPTLYCRSLGWMTDWLLPSDAEAQTRNQSPPRVVTGRGFDASNRGAARGVFPRRRSGEWGAFRDRAEGADIRAANYLVEVHKKRAIAAACIVFVLVGVPAALRFPRGGVGLVIGLSMVVFTTYYVGLIAGEALGNRLIVPPFWAMWTPNFLFATLGLGGLWRSGRGAAPASRGDWKEARAAILGVLLRPFRRAPA